MLQRVVFLFTCCLNHRGSKNLAYADNVGEALALSLAQLDGNPLSKKAVTAVWEKTPAEKPTVEKANQTDLYAKNSDEILLDDVVQQLARERDQQLDVIIDAARLKAQAQCGLRALPTHSPSELSVPAAPTPVSVKVLIEKFEPTVSYKDAVSDAAGAASSGKNPSDDGWASQEAVVTTDEVMQLNMAAAATADGENEGENMFKEQIDLEQGKMSVAKNKGKKDRKQRKKKTAKDSTAVVIPDSDDDEALVEAQKLAEADRLAFQASAELAKEDLGRIVISRKAQCPKGHALQAMAIIQKDAAFSCWRCGFVFEAGTASASCATCSGFHLCTSCVKGLEA